MSRELFNSWSDYQSAIGRILPLARKRVCIYDEDLVHLNLGNPERIETLQGLLALHRSDCLRIAVRNSLPLKQRQPLVMGLLRTYAHNSAAQETPDHLAQLRDAMIIVDDTHALVRFDRDQPRGKLLIDEPEEVAPYRRRFDEIWSEGGHPVSPTTLGL